MRQEILNKFKPRSTKGKPIYINEIFNNRQWLYFENNTFYCLYCVFFANDDNVVENTNKEKPTKLGLADGLDYTNQKTNLCQEIKRHEQSIKHMCLIKYVDKLLSDSRSSRARATPTHFVAHAQAHQQQHNHHSDDNSTPYNTTRIAFDRIIKIILHLATHGNIFILYLYCTICTNVPCI